MAVNDINDPRLGNAAGNYACQIADHCFLEAAGDLAVIVIIARPMGDGHFKAFCAATINGERMQGPTARQILKSVHNEQSIIHHAPDPTPVLGKA